MTMTIHITNHSMSAGNFNLVCFFWQMAHSGCRRTDDGVVFKKIPVEQPRYYSDMGSEATTEEYFRWKIHDICVRMIGLRGDSKSLEQGYALNITYDNSEDNN